MCLLFCIFKTFSGLLPGSPVVTEPQVKSEKSNTYSDNVVSNIIRAKAKPLTAAKTRKDRPNERFSNRAPDRATGHSPRTADAAARGGRVPAAAEQRPARPLRVSNPAAQLRPVAAPMSAPQAPLPAPAVRRVTVDDGSAGQRLDNFLLRELKGVPKTHVYRLIRAGEVRVNKGRAQADTRLVLGDEIRIPPVRLPERVLSKPDYVPAREFPIIFEDEHLLAINKPAGVAVHGGSGVSFGVIEQMRQARPDAKYLELVHRLDKETSGLLLIAKKRSALIALQEQFRERETGKTYAALVLGDWADNKKVLDVALLKFIGSDGERWVRAVESSHDPQADQAKRAISLVKVAQRLASRNVDPQGTFSLLDVTIKTGRTHQIRVHLAHAGHPILGDPKYGDFEANRVMARGPLRFERMFLHAKRLRFVHPATALELELQAPLPPECEKLLLALKD
jgi:23S rRNA pseudouridine955/2504/2580 synthase